MSDMPTWACRGCSGFSQGALRYQACDDPKCYLPATVPIELSWHFITLDRMRAAAESVQDRTIKIRSHVSFISPFPC